MGIILNKSASNSDIWVDTYIIPSIENGQVTEYQCIYRQPEAAIIQRAKKVYEARSKGKMHKEFSRKPLDLGNRLSIMMLFALSPSIGWILWTMPTIASAIAATLSVVLSVFACKTMTKSFNRLVKDSRKIVNHPIKQFIYTGSVNDVGQLGAAQFMVNSQLDSILFRVQSSSQEVEISSFNSSQMTELTVNSLNSQQVALELIATAIEEMTVTTSEVTKSTHSSLYQVQQVQKDAELGTESVHDAINAIQTLEGAIYKISNTLNSLEERSSQIDKVVDVIHEIADKTNLLALNAAIEAARAGESGRGFTVVADEVRTLAQQTRISTTEISDIINELHVATANTSTEMKGAQVLANSTVKRIEKTSENLLSIIEAINSINDMSTQIASANEEQNIVAQDVNEQIHTISDAATEASNQARKTLELSNNTVRMAQQQNNMVEIILANK